MRRKRAYQTPKQHKHTTSGTQVPVTETITCSTALQLLFLLHRDLKTYIHRRESMDFNTSQSRKTVPSQLVSAALGPFTMRISQNGKNCYKIDMRKSSPTSYFYGVSLAHCILWITSWHSVVKGKT